MRLARAVPAETWAIRAVEADAPAAVPTAKARPTVMADRPVRASAPARLGPDPRANVRFFN